MFGDPTSRIVGLQWLAGVSINGSFFDNGSIRSMLLGDLNKYGYSVHYISVRDYQGSKNIEVEINALCGDNANSVAQNVSSVASNVETGLLGLHLFDTVGNFLVVRDDTCTGSASGGGTLPSTGTPKTNMPIGNAPPPATANTGTTGTHPNPEQAGDTYLGFINGYDFYKYSDGGCYANTVLGFLPMDCPSGSGGGSDFLTQIGQALGFGKNAQTAGGITAATGGALILLAALLLFTRK